MTCFNFLKFFNGFCMTGFFLLQNANDRSMAGLNFTHFIFCSSMVFNFFGQIIPIFREHILSRNMTRFLLFQSIKDSGMAVFLLLQDINYSSMAGFSFIQPLFCSQMFVNLLCCVMISFFCSQLGFGFVVFGNFLSNMFAL